MPKFRPSLRRRAAFVLHVSPDRYATRGAGIARRASSERSVDAAEEQAFRRAALSVGKSVVRIQTVGGADRVGGMLTGTAATTGTIVSEDGYIVSSAFNFVSKPTTILIHVEGEKPFPAKLVATDHLRMLALLKIDARGLTPLRVARGKKVEVGQWAITVGRTYDSPEPSVSIGIVSAVNRVWGKAIQTDAKVSPVNYGGPLIDVAGDALGVIVPLSPSAKEETAGVEWYDSGIGFAIPMDDVLAAADRLKKGKDLFPGILGVTMKEGGIDDPAVIDHVRYDSPAEHAGIKAGDLLKEIDGHAITRHDEIKQVLGRRYAGDKVKLVVHRGDKNFEAETTLADVLPPYEPSFLGIMPVRVAGERSPGVDRAVRLSELGGRQGGNRGRRPHREVERQGHTRGRSTPCGRSTLAARDGGKGRRRPRQRAANRRGHVDRRHREDSARPARLSRFGKRHAQRERRQAGG